MKQILSIAYYEVRHIFKDPVAFCILFIVPLAFTLLFGSVYGSNMLRDVPIALVDLDNSTASQEVKTVFANNDHFVINEDIKTYADFEKAMKEGEVRGGLVIPDDFSSKLSQHQNTQILTVYEGSNLIWGYSIRKFAFEGIDEFNTVHARSYMTEMGMSAPDIDEVLNMVTIKINTWYNPNYGYINFLFMGVVFLLLHQLGLLGVSLTINREKESNTWIQFMCSSLSKTQIVLGKCLPYLVMNLFNYFLLLYVANSFVHAKIEGGILIITLLGLLYATSITFLGFFISAHTPNSLQVSRYLILVSIPLFMISGYTWPSYRIPAVITAISKISPFTWMAPTFRNATVKNLGMQDLWPSITGLVIMTLLFIFLAFMFRKDQKPATGKGLSVNSGADLPRRV
ncbi:MAG: ABC transporter permease [Bacillota bacterium]|nr:ABC transporter permease [Bacillota bacterium]